MAPALKMTAGISPLLYFYICPFFPPFSELAAWFTNKSKFVCGLFFFIFFFKTPISLAQLGRRQLCSALPHAASAKLSAKSQFLNLCQWRFVIERKVEKAQIDFSSVR